MRVCVRVSIRYFHILCLKEIPNSRNCGQKISAHLAHIVSKAYKILYNHLASAFELQSTRSKRSGFVNTSQLQNAHEYSTDDGRAQASPQTQQKVA